jgi:hypothetical protein
MRRSVVGGYEHCRSRHEVVHCHNIHVANQRRLCTITYMLSGFQGSAADTRVYHVARLTDFTIPPGKLYLADAGFAACDELLVPYHDVH